MGEEKRGGEVTGARLRKRGEKGEVEEGRGGGGREKEERKSGRKT